MGIQSAIKNELTSLWGKGEGKSLVVIACGWGLLLGTRMIYPVLLPYFRTTFDLSLTSAGLLVTILWLAISIGQLPGGVLADKYSERFVMTIGVIIVSLSLVLVISASTQMMLFIGTGVVGLGQSLYPIARITILSDIYPDRIGSALGVTMATGDLGQTILPPIAGAIAAALAWQAGLGFVIPMLVLAGTGIWFVLPAKETPSTAVDALSLSRARYLYSAMRRSNLVFVSFILFLFFLTWQSFTGLFPTYLVEEKGLSSSTAGVLFSIFFAFGVLVKPLAGAAYDRIGMRKALAIVLIGPVFGLGFLPMVEGFWSIVGVTAIISTMLGTGAITQSFLSDSFPKDIRGTGLGVVRTTVSSFGAMGPLIFGGIADRGYFNEGYVLLAVLLSAVILLTLRLPKSDLS